MAHQVIIWTDTPFAKREGLIAAAMGEAVKVIGVGGPRTAEIDQLARGLDCPNYDDLRKMLVDLPAAWMLLGSLHDARGKDIEAALTAGTEILALEPVTPPAGSPQGQAFDVAQAKQSLGFRAASSTTSGGGMLWFGPSFVRSEGWTHASEPLEVLEKAKLIRFSSLGEPGDCSLLSRLADAWRIVLQLGNLPLSIDASLSGPLTAPPEDPRGLTGNLAAHARLPDGASVLVEASDRAGPHRRSLDVIGRSGRLHAGDLEYQLYDGANQLMDQRKGRKQTDFIERVAADWTRLLTGQDKAALTADKRERIRRLAREVLACCQACALSARTGEPERPERMLQLQ